MKRGFAGRKKRLHAKKAPFSDINEDNRYFFFIVMDKKTHISPIGEQPSRFYEFILENEERDRSRSRSPQFVTNTR